MSPRVFPVRLLVLLVALLLAAGCDSGKSYPTAQAPKTLHVKLPPSHMAPRPKDDEDDEDDGDDEDDEDDGAPAPPRRGSFSTAGGAATRRPGARRPGAMAAPKTINGHPKGPRAEVFNAVVNNALRQATRCFAKEPSGKTLSFRVKMTVGNAGTVEEAKVISGPKKPKLRKCLCDVVKGLSFPAFEGPKVSQVIPFTAIRQ